MVLLALRRNQPALRRPFRLWHAETLAPFAFVCSNWIIYWTGFRTDSFLFILFAIVFVLYALCHHLVARMPAAEFGWRQIAWPLPWFGGLWLLSAAGDIGGGYGFLTFWPSLVAVAIRSLVVVELAPRSALPAEQIAEMMALMEKTVRARAARSNQELSPLIDRRGAKGGRR